MTSHRGSVTARVLDLEDALRSVLTCTGPVLTRSLCSMCRERIEKILGTPHDPARVGPPRELLAAAYADVLAQDAARTPKEESSSSDSHSEPVK